MILPYMRKPLTSALPYCVVLVMFQCLAQGSEGTGQPPHLNFLCDTQIFENINIRIYSYIQRCP